MTGLALPRRALCQHIPVRSLHVILRRQIHIGNKGRPQFGVRENLLPTTKARTRFAPSPTGNLHIGSLRTALYNYLLAKATGGQFILRLEDTDQARLVEGAESKLYKDLQWAGLDWDEGPDKGGPYGPYKQSERLTHYNNFAKQLLKEDKAYRCFCKPEDLDALKKQSLDEGQPGLYPGTCSHIPPDRSYWRASSGEPHCIRFRSGEKPFHVKDYVYGKYQKPEKEDDFIIIKRDGYPTYHFANVVDDHLMQVTHVIRGAEWLISTPRHVALYDAFGWQLPMFAHVGLLVDQSGQKLSKRHGKVDIDSWRDQNILPIALLNYLMLLGWSPHLAKGSGKRDECMNMGDMINQFCLKFTKGNITVNDKFEYLQGRHMRNLVTTASIEDLEAKFTPRLRAEIRSIQDGGAENARERLGIDIGDLIPVLQGYSTTETAASPTVADPSSPESEFVRRFLKFDVTNYRDAAAYVNRNASLLWQVPRETLENSLGEQIPPGRELRMATELDDQAAQAAPVTVTALTTEFRGLLDSVPKGEWEKESIMAALNTKIKAVRRCWSAASTDQSTFVPQNEKWGYSLLRWVLMGMAPGPAIVPSMVLLGKEETLRRFDQAIDVAQVFDKASNV